MDDYCAGTGASRVEPGFSYDSGSNTDFLNLVYRNVVGVAPSPGELNLYAGMLDSGTSRADLLAMAAATPLNAQHVNLVGLAATGLEYL